MEERKLEFVGGGGLVSRRSLLATGVSMLTAAHLTATSREARAADAAIGSSFPTWSKTPGRADTPYGQPSGHESHVTRKLQLPAVPENSLTTGWLTPIDRLQGILTPNGLHFGSHHFGIPDIDPGKHELVIHGMVEQPLRFTVDALLRYPMVSRIRFIECSGNTAINALSPFAGEETCQDLYGLLSCAEWSGIRVADLLGEAGVKEKASWVIAEGADGGSHSRSIPLAKLMDDAIIAFYQNGERLRPEQGYPMRLLTPGYEGNMNVKYLSRLQVVDKPAFTGHESGLYTEHLTSGEIQGFSFHMDVKSVITHPCAPQQLSATGFYEVSGLAWSGYGRIASVEVSADEGKTWAQADLQSPVIEKALTRFAIPWRWEGEERVLMSRATDSTGRTQPGRGAWKERFESPTFNHYSAIQPWMVSDDGRVSNVFL